MVFAHIVGGWIRAAPPWPVLISRALRLPGTWRSASQAILPVWTGKSGEPGTLTLHNAHIGNLMDAKEAWPKKGYLHLDGFTFNHLGGLRGETGQKMRERGMEWWDNWARRDTDYSPAPYAQLAAALMASGDRDAGNEIRYLGRVRERETETGLAYGWSGFLQYVAGFGIGGYTFRVLYWVIVITVIEALYLKESVQGCVTRNMGLSGASAPASPGFCQ
jgi:hypothetical protein